MERKEIRLIALDLDGTLLNSNKQLTDRNKAALMAAAELGIHIVPTTGRLACALTPSVSELPFIRYIISANGALVEDRLTGDILYRAEIPNENVLRILNVLSSYDGIYDCYIDGTGIMSRHLYERIPEYSMDRNQRELVQSTRKPVDSLEKFVRDSGCSAQKSQIIFRSSSERDRFLPEIRERLLSAVPDLILTCSLPNNIEINQAKANKGDAMTCLCEYLGFTAANTMAFGDGSNDISMLDAAGTGAVMANADDEIKKHGNLIAPDCNEDGVACVIEELVLSGSKDIYLK